MTRVRMLMMSVLVVLALGTAEAGAAQDDAVQITLPIHGYYVFPSYVSGQDRLILIDTFTGEWRVLRTGQLGISSPRWNPSGDRIAYQEGRIGSSLLSLSGDLEAIENFPDRDSVFFPEGWSADGTRLLYMSYSLLPQPAHFRLDILDLNSATLLPLLYYEEGQPFDSLIPLPADFPEAEFRQIRGARWNPVYEDWIALQLEAELGYDVVPVNLLYNLQTHESISLDSLFPNDGIASLPLSWSPDGESLLVHTSGGGITILKYSNADHAIEISDRVEESQAVLDWLGADELLFAIGGGGETGDAIFYAAEIQSGRWHWMELFRFSDALFGLVHDGDFHLTASPEEQQQFLALFDEET